MMTGAYFGRSYFGRPYFGPDQGDVVPDLGLVAGAGSPVNVPDYALLRDDETVLMLCIRKFLEIVNG